MERSGGSRSRVTGGHGLSRVVTGGSAREFKVLGSLLLGCLGVSNSRVFMFLNTLTTFGLVQLVLSINRSNQVPDF